jgi:hypothetical protein
MLPKTRGTENGIEKRTRRACTESMTVVAHSDGTEMFDVWTGACEEPYVVDLAGEHDRCTCPNIEHNLKAGERCKHARRVCLEFGLAPFGDVPPVRSEHAASMDVQLARRRRGIDDEPEPKPEPITVGDAKPARAVATDGGVVVSEPETRGTSAEDAAADLSADATVHLHGVVAETTSTIDDLPDFDIYCTAVEISTQHIRRLAAQEGAAQEGGR